MLERLLDRPREAAPDLVSLVDFCVTASHPATGVALVDPSGELDLLTSPTLDRYLRAELRDGWCTQLILDVSHLGFCGVAGLRSLLSARDLARDQHIDLYLVSGRVMTRLLSWSGLREQFVMCADVTAALAAASTPARLAVTRAPAPIPRCPADRVGTRLRVL
jgi:anti-anti-sigma factor